ncbi:MAG: group II truncated hemoglobin, partial [Polynucleobacter sp.]|nr:group II truncated hemoglobin [Polynucleobacter sp.]
MSQDPKPLFKTTSYELIGGAEPVRALVDRFYDLMELEEAYALIREMHPQDLSSSREKLYLFLSGWMGGPQLYQEKYGHPMLRARHLPFPIGSVERNQWLDCMKRAMDEVAIDPLLKDRLNESFFATA